MGRGLVPYGYSYNKDTKKLVKNPVEAVIVKRIFNDYVNGGTLHGVAESLQKDRIPPRGKHGMG